MIEEGHPVRGEDLQGMRMRPDGTMWGVSERDGAVVLKVAELIVEDAKGRYIGRIFFKGEARVAPEIFVWDHVAPPPLVSEEPDEEPIETEFQLMDTHTMTIEEALSHPDEFVAGMTEETEIHEAD